MFRHTSLICLVLLTILSWNAFFRMTTSEQTGLNPAMIDVDSIDGSITRNLTKLKEGPKKQEKLLKTARNTIARFTKYSQAVKRNSSKRSSVVNKKFNFTLSNGVNIISRPAHWQSHFYIFVGGDHNTGTSVLERLLSSQTYTSGLRVKGRMTNRPESCRKKLKDNPRGCNVNE